MKLCGEILYFSISEACVQKLSGPENFIFLSTFCTLSAQPNQGVSYSESVYSKVDFEDYCRPSSSLTSTMPANSGSYILQLMMDGMIWMKVDLGRFGYRIENLNGISP
jgi:hypothetical protein